VLVTLGKLLQKLSFATSGKENPEKVPGRRHVDYQVR
jgi:hypothetical protein